MSRFLLTAFLFPLWAYSATNTQAPPACLVPFYTPGQMELPPVGTKAVLKHQITRAQIEATARVTGDHNPLHTDAQYARLTRGYKDIVAHGILVTGLVSNLLGNQLPGPGTIFMQQESWMTQPAYPDDVLTVAAEVVEIESPRRGGAFPIIDIDVRNQRGEGILHGKVKLAYSPVKNYSVGGQPNYVFLTPESKGPLLLDTPEPVLQTGATLRLQQQITQAQINATAELTGDYNPLHMDPQFAYASAGFRDVVAHGILVGGLVSNLIGNYLPGRGSVLVHQKFAMRAPVFPGDTLTAAATVDTIEETATGQLVTVKVQVTNQDAKCVLRGNLTVDRSPNANF